HTKKLAATPEEIEIDELVVKGDEDSLRLALEVDPNSEKALVALSALLVGKGEMDEAMALLEKVPENSEVRQLRAKARLAGAGVDVSAPDISARLDILLESVKDDEAARQEYVDILESMGPSDPRTARYRKALSSRLF
ncbi:thioredoxin, partial [mine drainage metagenome]